MGKWQGSVSRSDFKYSRIMPRFVAASSKPSRRMNRPRMSSDPSATLGASSSSGFPKQEHPSRIEGDSGIQGDVEGSLFSRVKTLIYYTLKEYIIL